jgi:hypothetical protein
MNRYDSRFRPWTCWLVGAALSALVGCGDAGPERATVSGTVTFQGQPLQYGQIMIRPAEGTKAAASGAQIVDGEYTVDARGGVQVGTYTVRIEANRFKDTGQPAPPDAGEGDIMGGPPQEQYIPAKYNDQSTLTLTIPPGESHVTKDFALE